MWIRHPPGFILGPILCTLRHACRHCYLIFRCASSPIRWWFSIVHCYHLRRHSDEVGPAEGLHHGGKQLVPDQRPFTQPWQVWGSTWHHCQSSWRNMMSKEKKICITEFSWKERNKPSSLLMTSSLTPRSRLLMNDNFLLNDNPFFFLSILFMA